MLAAGGRRTAILLWGAVSIGLAAIFTASFDPYIPTADGMLRWVFAEWLVSDGAAPFQPLLVVSKGPALLQAAVLGLGLPPVAFTFAQAAAAVAALHAAVFILARGRLSPMRVSAVVLLISLPTMLAVFFVVLSDSVWTLIGLVALVAALVRPVRGRPLRMLGLLVAAAILFASRANALALLPALALVVVLQGLWRARWREILIVAAGALLAVAVPDRLAPSRPVNPLALGLSWEIVGVAQETTAPELLRALDFVGDTAKAAAFYDARRLNPIFWDADPPLPVQNVVDPGKARRILDVYLDTIAEHPVSYAAVKLRLWGGVLGITEGLLHPALGFDFDQPAFRAAGGEADAINRAMFQAFVAVARHPASLAAHPWVLMTAGALLLIARRERRSAADLLIVLALAYYLTFLLNAQAMEFRYFAPSYFVLLAAVLTELAVFVQGRFEPR